MIGLKSDKNNLCVLNRNSCKALKSISPSPMLHHSCARDEKFLFVLKNFESGIYLPSMHCQLLSYPSSYLIKVISYLDIVQDHLFYLDGSKDPRSWPIAPNLSQRQFCNFPSIFLHVLKLGLFV